MASDTQTDGLVGQEEQQQPCTGEATPDPAVRRAGTLLAASLSWLPDTPSGDMFAKRCRTLEHRLETVFERVRAAFAKNPGSEDLLWLRDNAQQLSSAAKQVSQDLASQTSLPVVASHNEILPRVLAIAKAFLAENDSTTCKTEFTDFCLAFEETSPLEYREIGALLPSLKLILLEHIAALGKRLVNDPAAKLSRRVTTFIRTLQHVTQSSWKDELESLVPFDRILQEDPAGAYASMDVESRNIYRETVSRIAQRSDLTELEISQEALNLARQAQQRKYGDPRIGLRESHIGYYLVGEGTKLLGQRVGFHPTFGERFRMLLRNHPDEFLLLGIAVLTFTITTGAVWLLTPPTTSPEFVMLSMLIMLLPGSQAAVQLMNYLTTNLLPAATLPKLDFSEGVPDDCVSLVAIPTLLLNEVQVKHLVDNLEVRFLGNHDPNIHFALVSDLPDSNQPAPEDSELVGLCAQLIRDLNEKYAAKNSGTFFLLHRHRVYNPREKGWMGWERKRGKLLDLNQFLRGQFDSFPVKVGDLSLLPKVRFVITLDSDTELPRGAAHRMIGALAHPLNQAITDPAKNIVVAGYGILQPQVGISVHSTARSRLAAIFAGETGLDPYTRAISDVYQDLYGEGTFTGKGIYEVDTMFRVLYGRFPRNSLLSHDLIEGAYARAGLTTDIIVIEDYPSHYSAYNRRKHRWLRGDWQIVEWLTDQVPDESGAHVPNPISLVSRWKIFDNLRRSLVEPATFTLLLFGWLATRHPVLWTIATICILFVPAWAECLFGLVRAAVARQPGVAKDALSNLVAANFTVFLTLTLLAHQTLLSVDAVVRALVRHLVTRERLLEWETAAEAELGARRTPFERYIDWMPFLGIGLGVLIWLARPKSLLAAAPILLLWTCSKLLVLWLNASPIKEAPELPRRDIRLLRRSALFIWRYFAEFSNADQNWLIPDNVQANPWKVAGSVSPTNVGLLLNARQAAAALGYITAPEFIDLTQKTLDTISRLKKYRGHLMNWYDTRTLEPKAPFFISSVDSGNLVASLWTLQQGCLHQFRHPLLSKALADSFLDHLRALNHLRALPRRTLAQSELELQGTNWLNYLLQFPEDVLAANEVRADEETAADVAWLREQARARIKNVRNLVDSYAPWELPEFAPLRAKLTEGLLPFDKLAMEYLHELIVEIDDRLEEMLRSANNGNASSGNRLKVMLADARRNITSLTAQLSQCGGQARDLANAMDFSFLLDEQRLLMSVGFDAGSEELAPYCYDLLATEPRTAVFISIAKEDVPQDSWFRLDRPFARDQGHPVLMSWTGTMFEYLMPSIWMRTYPNTLLDRAGLAAVRSQQAYGRAKGIPWGISESACARRNDAGDYHYEAFGVPALALKKSNSDPLVVSPYSTFLAVGVDPKGSLRNLHRMDALGWFGPYGFREAADYTKDPNRPRRARYELVHSWMVHHQGMSLLSLANYLCDNIVQTWFHSDPRVQATELLLQEKPVSLLSVT